MATVELKCVPSSDPLLYSPRGPLESISISEGRRTFTFDRSILQKHQHLKAIEDIWPQYSELYSKKPGIYLLRLSYGVPQGAAALILQIDRDRIVSVQDWLDPHYAMPAR